MTIALAEDWLIALCRDELGDAVDIDTGPGEWDGSYLKNLIRSLPALRILCGTAALQPTRHRSIVLAVTWTFYVVTGWEGQDQKTRRRAAANGAYLILAALANRLHNTNMGEAQFNGAGTRIAEPIDGAGRLRVSEVVNEWSGEWDRVGVAIYSIVFDHQMPLEFEAAAGSLSDWLGGAVDIDLPDTEPDPDLPGTYDLPQ